MELARRTGLPVVHLDLLFWRPGWTAAPKDDAERDLARAVQGERWILDGNFLPSDWVPDDRFARADTVVFLDLPRRVCLWRVLSRRLRDRGRKRPDLPEGCAEGFDPGLIRWIWSYSATDRPRVLGLLGKLRANTTVHHLRTPADVERFQATFPRG